MIVRPGEQFTSVDRGVYNILVWQGKGRFGGVAVEAWNPEMDELLICHDAAVRPVVVENTGTDELIIYKFFGPDINPHVPMLEKIA